MIVKKMNLLPIEYQKQYEVDTKAFVKKAIISSVLIITVALLFLGKYQLHALENNVESLEQQYQLLMEKSNSLTVMKNELNNLEQRWNEYNQLSAQSVPLSQLITDITEATPKDVWFTAIELAGEANTVEQTTTAQSTVTQSANAQSVDTQNVDTQNSGTQAIENVDANQTSEYTVANNQQGMQLNIEGYGQSVSSVGTLTYLLNQLPYMNNVTIDYSAEIKVNDASLVEFKLSGYIIR